MGLLRQVRTTAAKYDVGVSGENALCRFDDSAFDRIISNVVGGSPELPPMASFTFLRLRPELFNQQNFPKFMRFVRHLRERTCGNEPDQTVVNLPEPYMDGADDEICSSLEGVEDECASLL